LTLFAATPELTPFGLLALVTAVALPTAYLAGRTEGRRHLPPVLRHGVPAKAPGHAVERAARDTANALLVGTGVTMLDLEVRTLRPPFQVVAVVVDDDGVASIRATDDTMAGAARRLGDAAAHRKYAPQRT
jgi:hypothetical protein